MRGEQRAGINCSAKAGSYAGAVRLQDGGALRFRSFANRPQWSETKRSRIGLSLSLVLVTVCAVGGSRAINVRSFPCLFKTRSKKISYFLFTLIRCVLRACRGLRTPQTTIIFRLRLFMRFVCHCHSLSIYTDNIILSFGKVKSTANVKPFRSLKPAKC